MARTRKAGSKRRRRLLWAVVGLLLLTAGFWLGLNLWLGTSSFTRLVNRKPEKILIEWSDAKMLVPGRIKVRDLRIRGHQRRMDWYVEVEQAEFLVDLWALKEKTFRTKSVTGEGIRFLLRQRPKEGVNETRVEHYPDIPGTPIETAEPRPEGPRRPPGWKIELGGLDLRRAEEIWFNDFRLRGKGEFSGEMGFQVRGPMHYDGLNLSWTDGLFELGGREVATALDLETQVDIDSVVPREAKGLKFLEYLIGRLKLDGDFEDVQLLQYYLKNAGDLDLNAKGRLSCDLRLDRGRVEPGSTLLLDASQMSASFSSYGFDGRGTIKGSVSEPTDDEPAVSEMRLSLRDVEAHGLAESPLTASTGVDVVIRVPDPDLMTEFRDPQVILELPDLQLPDLRVFNSMIPEGLGLSIVKGRAEVVANLDMTRSEGHNALQVRGEEIVLDVNGRHLGGDLAVDVRYAGGLTPTQISIDGTRLAVGPPTLGADGTPDGGLWADFTFKDGDLLMDREGASKFTPDDGRLVLEGRIADLALLNDYLSYGKWLALHGAVDLDANLHVGQRSIRSGSLVELRADHLLARFMGWEVGGRAKIAGELPEDPSEQPTELRLDFEQVEIGLEGEGYFRGPDLRLRAWGPDLSGGAGLEGLNVRVDVEEVDVLDASLLNKYLPHRELISLSAGDLKLLGHAVMTQHAGDARFELTAEGLGAHLRGEPFRTDMVLEVDMHTDAPGSRHFSIDGSRLRLEDTRWGETEEGEATPAHWEGEFDIIKGVIDLGQPPTIDGSVELILQDTGPLMQALFSKSEAAGWFETWLLIHDVDGTADVHLGADGMRLDDLKLTSDLVKLDASVHMTPPKPGGKGHVEEVRARGELIKPLTIEFDELNHLLHSHVIEFTSGIGEMLGHIEIGGDAASAQLLLAGQELGASFWGEPLATDLSLDIEMQSDDMHSHRFDVSGTSLRLDGSHWLGDEYAEKHPGWWAEMRLLEAQVVLGKPLTIDATIELHLRDTHPLVYLLGTKSKPAQWFHRFLEIREVDGTARLHLGPDGVRLDDVHIEGKGLKIEGRMELGEGHEYALFHLVLHHLGAAMEMRDGEHEMKLINAKHWYEGRLHGTTEDGPGAAP